MSAKKNTVSVIWDIAAPIAENLGLILWDVRFQKEGANWYLRIFIDKDGGVCMDDCVNMSHALDEPLDALDPIEQSYSLQVSSPGIERDLIRDEHFIRYLGSDIKLRLPRAVDGRREFSGVLEKYEDGKITLREEDGNSITVDKKETSWVRLDDFKGFD